VLPFSLSSLLYYILLCLSGSSVFGFSFFWVMVGGAGIGLCVGAERGFLGVIVRHIGKKQRIVLLLCGVLAAVLIISAFVFIVTVPRPATYKGTFLIVLGAGIRRNGVVSTTLASRLDTAIMYLHSHPSANVIVSGGQGADEPIPESQAMANYLVARQINADRIFQESRSSDTIENLRFSRQLLILLGKDDQSIVLLTSDFHCARALFLARHLGFTNITGMSAPTHPFQKPTFFIREILAVLKLWGQFFFTFFPFFS
jgi:uncharacterized SAM-binding protein YcdF (DUF218 family)